MAKTEIIRNKHGQEICGGRKRSGELCAQTKIFPNGRCKHHGGKNPPPGPAHPLYKNGSGSKFGKKLPVHLRRAYQASMNDPNILSLENELGLLDARVLDLIEKLSTGESAEKVEMLSLNLTEMRRILLDDESDEVNVDELEEMIERMHGFLGSIMNDRSIWSEIKDTIEVRRKVSDTERRLIEAQQHAIDAVQLRQLITFFLGSLRDHVLPLEGGREAILGVTHDMRKIMRDADPGDIDLDPGNGIEA